MDCSDCRWIAALGVGLCVWLAGGSEAQAQEPAPQHAHESSESKHPSTKNLLGVRVGYLHAALNREGSLVRVPGVLAGLSYERTLIPRWLEIEISVPVAVLLEDDETVVAIPIDVHLKKPFHVSRRFTPYIGVGPAVDIEIEPELKAAYGGSVAVGGYVWFTDSVGFDLEVDYNLVVDNDRRLGQELFLAAGPVVRF